MGIPEKVYKEFIAERERDYDMELLLQHINSTAPIPYWDIEIQKIAAFIAGNEDFEAIKPILLEMQRYDYDETILHRIGKEASQYNELLPALGRYMKVIDYVTQENEFYYIHILSGILKSGLSIEKVYVESGMGADYMLRDVLRTINTYAWLITPKLLGFPSYQEFFEKMYVNYPEGFTTLTGLKCGGHLSFFAYIFLYARSTEKYASYEDNIINLCAPLLKSKEASLALNAVGKEAHFANNSFIQTLLNRVKIQAVAQEKNKDFINMFSLAYDMSPHGNELLDLIQFLLAYINKYESVNAVRKMEEHITNDYNVVHEKLLETFSRGLYPKEKFFTLFCEGKYRLHFYDQSEVTKKLLRKLALEHEDDALKAAEISNLTIRVFLLSAFWEQSKHLDKVAMVEKEVLEALMNTNSIEDREELKALICGEAPQNTDEHLLLLDIHADSFANINAMLSIASPLPSRFSEYSMDVILSMKRYSYMVYFERLLSIMQECYGENATECFLAGLIKPAHNKILLLLELFSFIRFTEKDILKKQILAVGDLKTVEKAYEFASAKGRVILLEIIIESGYKPEFLIKCLFDSSKKVRELAVEYLTPKVELKEQIEELLKAKKKAVRECAERLMMAYNGYDSFAPSSDDELTHELY